MTTSHECLKEALEAALLSFPEKDRTRYETVVTETRPLLTSEAGEPMDLDRFRELYRCALKASASLSPATVRNRITRLNRLLEEIRARGLYRDFVFDPEFPLLAEPAQSGPERRRFDAFTRFVRFCTERRIRYIDVDQRTASAFRDHLTETLAVTTAEARYDDLRRFWTERADDGLLCPLPIPPFRELRRTRYGLTDWPDRWKEDFNRFQRAAEGRVHGNESVWGQHLEPNTITIYRRDVRQFLGYLSLRLLIIDSRAPEQWLTDTRLVADYLEWHIRVRCNGNERVSHADTLRRFARLVRFLYNVQPAAEEYERMADSIRPLPGKDHFQELDLSYADLVTGATSALHHSRRIWHEEKGGSTRLSAARHYRDAFLMAFLVLRPLRAENIVSLTVHGHLVRSSNGYTLQLDAYETKGKTAYRGPFPRALADALELYLTEVLPSLPCSESGLLFPSRLRGQMRTSDLSRRVQQIAARYLGVRCTTHDFRRMVASAYLMEFPGEFQTVQQLLGHRYLQTTLKYYVRVRSVHASRKAAEFTRAVCPSLELVGQWTPSPNLPF